MTSITRIALVTLDLQSITLISQTGECTAWLAFDFRCLHARQAVEAFRVLADADGELIRAPVPAGNGANGGGPGRGGDMIGKMVVMVMAMVMVMVLGHLMWR